MSSLRHGARRFLPALAACFAALIPAASAQAVTLPAATLSLPIRVPSMGGFSLGAASLTVTYTDTAGTATAVAPAVMLGSGHQFRVSTCITAHVSNGHDDTTCQQSFVDTRADAATITVSAPTATATFARPAAGGSGYVKYIVSVGQLDTDGVTYKEIASSWPAGGLSGAGVAMPPVGSLTGTLPAGEGLALPSSPTDNGGVDTGRPNSFCASDYRATPGPAEDGVSSTGLPAPAPAYYEIGQPSGAYQGQAPKGVMLLLHGGGWYTNGPGAVATMRDEADRWRARGWETLNASYRPCAASVNDALWFFDQARAQWGTSIPYCTEGASAGGQLALEVAWARGSSVSCVVDEAGPTDTSTLATQTAYSATSAAGQLDGPHWVYNVMAATWGSENLAWYSPAKLHIPARVLVGVAQRDTLVPFAQATELHDHMLSQDPSAYVDVDQLAGGTVPWVHANVTQAALDDFTAREDTLVAPLTG